jgi:hypothetical protein
VLAALGATVRGHELSQTLVTRVPLADGTVKECRESFTVSLAGERARLRHENGEDFIVRLDRGEVMQLDVLLRNYRRQTFKELRFAWEERNAQLLEQIEAAPPGHPLRAELIEGLDDGPAKWAQVWKLPAGPPRARLVALYRLPEEPPVVEVRATEESKEVLGIATRRYESLEDGTPTAWAHLAPSLAFNPRYFEFMELQQWITPELAARLQQRSMRRAGMPLETLVRTRRGVELAVTTTALREAEFDVQIFDVPEGYLEQKRKPAIR